MVFFSKFEDLFTLILPYLQKSLFLFLKILLVIPNSMFFLTLQRGYNKTKAKARMRKTAKVNTL